jgi:hypothetical protein
MTGDSGIVHSLETAHDWRSYDEPKYPAARHLYVRTSERVVPGLRAECKIDSLVPSATLVLDEMRTFAQQDAIITEHHRAVEARAKADMMMLIDRLHEAISANESSSPSFIRPYISPDWSLARLRRIYIYTRRRYIWQQRWRLICNMWDLLKRVGLRGTPYLILFMIHQWRNPRCDL